MRTSGSRALTFASVPTRSTAQRNVDLSATRAARTRRWTRRTEKVHSGLASSDRLALPRPRTHYERRGTAHVTHQVTRQLPSRARRLAVDGHGRRPPSPRGQLARATSHQPPAGAAGAGGLAARDATVTCLQWHVISRAPQAQAMRMVTPALSCGCCSSAGRLAR